ncbi:MAG TPA: NUDIX hydrolase [Chloroflexia bacterium]|nr:NUDIX hydrolase [Chloroflexia bacterium]
MVDLITCYSNDGRAVDVPRDRVRLRPSVYGVALTDDRGQVLLTRDRRSDVWELPGGGVDPGEAAGAAMVREFGEEVGLTIALGPPIYFADSFYYHAHDGVDEGWHSLKLFYVVHTQGTLDPTYEENREHGGVNYGAAWVPVEELDHLNMLADHYDAVQRALQWLDATEGPPPADDTDDDD